MEVDISRVNGAVQFWQYDYGQSLTFKGFLVPEDTEAHFYMDTSEFTRYVSDGKVEIPDILLTASGIATLFLYIDTGDSGRTVKKILVTILPRARPQDYVEPAQENTPSRRIPAGGEVGQILVKKSDDDYDVEWGTPEEVYAEVISDSEIDEICK